MKKYPQCKRFSIEYDPLHKIERCLWRDCLWVNREGKNLDVTEQEEGYVSRWKELQEKGLLVEV